MSAPATPSLPDWQVPVLWSDRERACWKTTPESFQVDEIANPERVERGEHVLLELSKRGQNTQWVVEQLARFAGVRDFDIGYHGLKDRQAVTRQFLSVYLGPHPEPDWIAVALPGVALTRLGVTPRKLRRGDHQGNRFRIELQLDTPLESAALARFEARLETLRRHGFPNAFGAQRFGHDGETLRAGVDWLRQGGRRLRQRALQGLYLSAVRSALFNSLLRTRVGNGTWQCLLSGDRPLPAASAAVSPACLVPSGRLFGGPVRSRGELEAIEREVCTPWEDLLAALHRQGMRDQPRPLVARCDDLSATWVEPSRLILTFSLGVGCYASVLLQQLFELDRETQREVTDIE